MDDPPRAGLLDIYHAEMLREMAKSQEEREYEWAVRAHRSARRRMWVDGAAAALATTWVADGLVGGSVQWWYATFMAVNVLDFVWGVVKLRRARAQMELALVATVQES